MAIRKCAVVAFYTNRGTSRLGSALEFDVGNNENSGVVPCCGIFKSRVPDLS